MVLLLRLLARFTALVLLVALALLGLAAAIFAIEGDRAQLSEPTLARHLQLPHLRRIVGEWLGDLAAAGPTGWITLIAGLATVLLGLVLLAGILVPPRERLLLVERTEEGSLLARRRALAQIAAALADQTRGVTAAKARVRPRRRGVGGRLRVRAVHPRSVALPEVERRVRAAIDPFSESFHLRSRVALKTGTPRVQ
jgi:hypothetical protein